MQEFPIIKTQRLILSDLQAADIPQIVKHASNKNVAVHTLNLPHPYSEKDAIYWINMANQGFKNQTNFIFAIRLKETGELIGGIGLALEKKFFRADIGYWIGEQFWNKGFATEATRAAIEFGFAELELNKLTACYVTGNPASGKVMVKCGMKKEGELKEHIFKSEVFETMILYGLTKRDYLEAKVK